MNRGFTLVEILIAVLIMGILVTMAVPMYEKTIEKSRIAEVRANLRRIYDAKMRLLDDMEKTKYVAKLFGFENLDFSFDCSLGEETDGHMIGCKSKDFGYSLLPSGTGNQNKVCAMRLSGDYKGVNFLFGERSGAPGTVELLCYDNGNDGACDVFGMESVGSEAWCK
ncbi:type IV pilin protein [Candidatus Avelusimicrobium luingense]|uniref:type IV pilin protein n=1 Tax=Candidatus Avelusimicrobium luingense TaxID=3416211 RepID=UPI003D0A99DD